MFINIVENKIYKIKMKMAYFLYMLKMLIKITF